MLRMVRLEAEVGQDGAVGALGDLQGNAVPLPETALLPRPEDVEEDAHADDYAYRHGASRPAVGRTPLHGHGRSSEPNNGRRLRLETAARNEEERERRRRRRRRRA